MKLRWFIVGMILLILVGVLAVLTQLTRAMPPQNVVLSDGTVLIFTESMYGTNHVIGSPEARLLARFPKLKAGILSPLAAKFGPVQVMTTSRPSLTLLYHNMPITRPLGSKLFPAYLADETGFNSGIEAPLFSNNGVGSYRIVFEAFPRRGKTLQFHIHEPGKEGSTAMVTNIPNPLYGSFPQWTPETLPSTRKAGDLQVRLLQFGTGFGQGSRMNFHPGGTTISFAPNDGSGQNYSVFEVAFEELGKTNVPWTVAGVTLSDATGNELSSTSMGGSGNGLYNFEPSLWPGESAWKLKLTVKRQSNFPTNELFTFKAVPLGILNQTNFLGITTNRQGATITLDHFVLRVGRTNKNSWVGAVFSEVTLSAKGIPPGYYLDLSEARSGTNRWTVPSSSSGGTHQTYGFDDIPVDAKTVDLTFALHPSRSVEFLVKPTVGDPKLTRVEKKN